MWIMEFTPSGDPSSSPPTHHLLKVSQTYVLGRREADFATDYKRISSKMFTFKVNTHHDLEIEKFGKPTFYINYENNLFNKNVPGDGKPSPVIFNHVDNDDLRFSYTYKERTFRFRIYWEDLVVGVGQNVPIQLEKMIVAAGGRLGTYNYSVLTHFIPGEGDIMEILKNIIMQNKRVKIVSQEYINNLLGNLKPLETDYKRYWIDPPKVTINVLKDSMELPSSNSNIVLKEVNVDGISNLSSNDLFWSFDQNTQPPFDLQAYLLRPNSDICLIFRTPDDHEIQENKIYPSSTTVTPRASNERVRKRTRTAILLQNSKVFDSSSDEDEDNKDARHVAKVPKVTNSSILDIINEKESIRPETMKAGKMKVDSKSSESNDRDANSKNHEEPKYLRIEDNINDILERSFAAGAGFQTKSENKIKTETEELTSLKQVFQKAKSLKEKSDQQNNCEEGVLLNTLIKINKLKLDMNQDFTKKFYNSTDSMNSNPDWSERVNYSKFKNTNKKTLNLITNSLVNGIRLVKVADYQSNRGKNLESEDVREILGYDEPNYEIDAEFETVTKKRGRGRTGQMNATAVSRVPIRNQVESQRMPISSLFVTDDFDDDDFVELPANKRPMNSNHRSSGLNAIINDQNEDDDIPVFRSRRTR